MRNTDAQVAYRRISVRPHDDAHPFSSEATIERALRKHFRRREWAAAQARDIERINAAADQLNEEAQDVLEYQAPLWDEDRIQRPPRCELYRVRKPRGGPRQSRVFVVVGRQALLRTSFSTVICANRALRSALDLE